MKKPFTILSLIAALVFVGCTDNGGDGIEDNNDYKGSYSINGSIQKGPFIQGSSITIQPLNNKLNPTGQMFTTQTTNDAGLFSMEGISSKYAEIIATGYYFNEIAGSVSTGMLTLRSIADLEDGGQTNVNLLTTIIFQRVQNLVKNEKMSIPEATINAERELFLALGIPEDKIPDVRCERMNISEDGEHNGLLLAITVVLQQYRSVGDLSELIAKMGSDLANDGQLDESIMSKLTILAYANDLVGQVTNNLFNRYNDLGVKGVVPPFASYLRYFQDFDGDGTSDGDKFAILEYTYTNVSEYETFIELPFLYVDMESCEISISDKSPEAKEWVTLTIYGDKCFVSVGANTTESERHCEIIIKERESDRFVTFTIFQKPFYKIEYTYNSTTSTGELWVDCGSNLTHSTHSNGEGALFYDSPICYIGGVNGDITSITLPSSVERIENDAFSNCPNLVEFRGPLASEDGMLLVSNSEILAVIVSVTECTIPDSVTSIGNRAFYECTSLTSVTIPNSVTSIENRAFWGCTSLTSVTFPDSVTSIGDYAFWGCTSLTSVTIPDSVTSIGSGAFRYCYSLTSITIPDSVTSIGDGAFTGCDSLSNFYGKFTSEDGRCLIVDGVLNSFARAGLTEYTIPDSVTSIGDGAFDSCYSLTSIAIPDSVTSIGYGAFAGCSSLVEVYCKPTTPPSEGNFMFVDNAVGRKIYVPTESVNAYKAAAGWSDYASAIMGYDFE